MIEENTSQYKLQNQQYKFPYHWIQFEDNFDFFSSYRGKPYYTVFMRHVINTIKQLAPTSVLDVGCGDGLLISYLQKERIGTSWGGVDLSHEAITLAKLHNNEVEFFCGDFKELIDKKYNLITCTEVLEHIPDEMIIDFIYALFDKLEEHGKLLITVPTIAMKLSILVGIFSSIRLLPMQPHPGHHSIAAF